MPIKHNLEIGLAKSSICAPILLPRHLNLVSGGREIGRFIIFFVVLKKVNLSNHGLEMK